MYGICTSGKFLVWTLARKIREPNPFDIQLDRRGSLREREEETGGRRQERRGGGNQKEKEKKNFLS